MVVTYVAILTALRSALVIRTIFQDCSISATGGSSGHVDGAINHNLGYFGMDQYQYSSAFSFFDNVRPTDETMEEDQVEDHGSPEIQTLPLFPVHCEDIHGHCNLKSNSSNYVLPSSNR
ncbi:hypothetical protein RIF29_29973 [Crotalaria pallida]|uniref:Uncharacterized protein n=1 Tax=Crotalaria pallida TaxID=3830 RepID=A0AAN9EFU4_CROPI